MEDRFGRAVKQYELAGRMVTHKARTKLIIAYTGLTMTRTKTLRSAWNVGSKLRRRGPQPSSLSVFFNPARKRSEASALAVLCRLLRAVSPGPLADAARRFPSIDRGEHLCDVFEVFRTFFPKSGITFDKMELLAVKLAEGDLVELRPCTICGATILVDRLAVHPRVCPLCPQPVALNKPPKQKVKQAVISTTPVGNDALPFDSPGDHKTDAPSARQMANEARADENGATTGHTRAHAIRRR